MAFLGHVIDPATLSLMLAAVALIALLQNGPGACAGALAALRPLVMQRSQRDRDAARALMLKVDHLAQSRGLACTDRLCSGKVDAAHPFLGQAVRRLANSEKIENFELWIAQSLADRADRHQAVRNVWLSVADAAPALGMAGTVIGLIGMFAGMDDPASIGPAMALAMLTTLYGVVIANLVAAPIAGRLADLSARELGWQRELSERLLAVARREQAPLRRAAIREVA